MVCGNGQSNGVIQFYPGPSLVAMATKCDTDIPHFKLLTNK